MMDENHGQSLGYKGYQWEPDYTEEELAEIPSDSQDRNTEHARSTDLSWCTCSFCTPMPVSCIKCHQDFALICLNPLVLETAYVTFLCSQGSVRLKTLNAFFLRLK